MNESAFPSGDHRGYEPESGMTLRDYFAAAALTGLMEQSGVLHDKEIAKWAYQFADAMLRARESQEAPHTPQEDRELSIWLRPTCEGS